MSDRFNGAAFFQSGKSKRVRRDIPDAPGASMEPLFFKAENRKWLELTHENVQWGFNGAAFFQSGKYADGVRIAAFFGGLQWSRFFSKRKTPGL